jgi:hypothetical protein
VLCIWLWVFHGVALVVFSIVFVGFWVGNLLVVVFFELVVVVVVFHMFV